MGYGPKERDARRRTVRDKRIRALFRGGHSVSELAEGFDLSRQSIYTILGDLIQQRKNEKAELVGLMTKAYEFGFPVWAIAEHFQISRTTTRRLIFDRTPSTNTHRLNQRMLFRMSLRDWIRDGDWNPPPPPTEDL